MKNLKFKTFAIFICLFALKSNAQSLSPRIQVSYFTSNYRTRFGVENREFPSRLNSTKLVTNDFGNFMFKTGIVFKYKNFEISADGSVFCNKTSLKYTSFEPRLAIWDFSSSYIINKIKISFNHQCIHPVISSYSVENKMYGGFEGFSVSYGY